MNIIVKIGIYLVLIAGLAWTSWSGYQASQQAAPKVSKYESELTSVPGSGNQPVTTVTTNSPSAGSESSSAGAEPAPQSQGKAQSRMITYFLLAALFLIILAFLVARDVATYSAEKAIEVIYNTEGGVTRSDEYEAAEEQYAAGNYIKAIELLKAYYSNNPSDVFAARRAAEIYEKDLQNYSAAAMEYEELLKLPLPPVRWGWMAIHLCNLYTGKLDNPDRAVELLQQIVMNHTDTPAGKKARERLELLGFEIEIVSDEADSPMPRGFKPKS